MNDDKVTLEWLMRFDGVEQLPINPHVVMIPSRIKGNLRMQAVKSDDLAEISVRVAVLGESVELYNPTIARFHEAVAFLGAKLLPLRPGEA